MRKLLTFLVALGAIVFAVVSPVSANGVLFLAQSRPAAPTYQGPGDLTGYSSGVKLWYGLRAFSAATRGSRLLNACNSTGGVDVGCADLSSDPVTGLIVPATVSGITCPGTNCTVKILYDQSGANVCASAACDLTQATVANRPTLLANCTGSKPCMSFVATPQFVSITGSGTFTSISAPYTLSAVVFNASHSFAHTFFAPNHAVIFQFNNALAFDLEAGTKLTLTAADTTYYAAQGLIAASTGGKIQANGATTSGTTGTGVVGGSGTTPIQIGRDDFSDSMVGQVFEAGLWAGDQSANFNAMESNQRTFWGF